MYHRRRRKYGVDGSKILMLIFFLALFTVLGTKELRNAGVHNTKKNQKISDEKFRAEFSWMAERNYGGKRGHEGTDIMAEKNKRGLYPVVSITDGVISNLGWLDKGGYRIGITTGDGTYYYYAHLDSYANIKEGSPVKAGELLGYMGDSGYGKEGTTGKFDVHLHMGIYFYKDGEEISVNPYYLLKYLENNKLKYAYS